MSSTPCKKRMTSFAPSDIQWECQTGHGTGVDLPFNDGAKTQCNISILCIWTLTRLEPNKEGKWWADFQQFPEMSFVSYSLFISTSNDGQFHILTCGSHGVAAWLFMLFVGVKFALCCVCIQSHEIPSIPSYPAQGHACIYLSNHQSG